MYQWLSISQMSYQKVPWHLIPLIKGRIKVVFFYPKENLTYYYSHSISFQLFGGKITTIQGLGSPLKTPHLSKTQIDCQDHLEDLLKINLHSIKGLPLLVPTSAYWFHTGSSSVLFLIQGGFILVPIMFQSGTH